MDTHLQPPKCFICEQKHWASEECPDEKKATTPKVPRVNSGERSGVSINPHVWTPADDTIELPKSDYEALVADAEKWRKERERRRRYMRKKRGKG